MMVQAFHFFVVKKPRLDAKGFGFRFKKGIFSKRKIPCYKGILEF